MTGRTHQIRVHSAYIGYPTVGDKKYGNFSLNSDFMKLYNYENQFLHAYKMIFTNLTGKLEYLNGMSITCPLPKEKQDIIDKIFK